MKDLNALLKPEVAVNLVLRYRWLIMVPCFFSIIIGIFLIITLPREYEAKTLILVEPQRVPSEYVRSVVTTDINERIGTISQQILSRTNLEKIIDEFTLYNDSKYDSMYPEDKLDDLRGRIKVSVTRARGGADAFSISFRGREPHKVVKIANTLASYFIDENLRVREAQALGTSDFLSSELETMRLKLETVETSMKEFREKYMGELPEQLQTNLSIVGRYQEQLNSKETSLRTLEGRMADLNERLSNVQDNVATSEGGTTAESPVASLSELYAQLETLKSKYTEKHPDVIRLKKIIADRINREKMPDSNQEDNIPIESYGMRAQIKRQMHQVNLEIVAVKQEIREIEGKIATYQTHIENTPKREQELLELRRDYANIQEAYNSLLNRKLEAEIAVNMERKQKGEQFRIIDTAKLPEKPIKPNIKAIFFGALVVGIGIGLGLTVLMEFLDNTYQSENEIESELKLSVLTIIPVIRSNKEVFLSKLNNGLSYAFLSMILVSFAGLAFISFAGLERTMGLIQRSGIF